MNTLVTARVVAALLAFSALPAWAAGPPGIVNYQGVLRDSSSSPLTGNYDMVFRFYDALTGGNELFVDSHLASGSGAVTTTNGLFNSWLGGGDTSDGSSPGHFTSLPQVFQSCVEVYLEVEVAGEVLAPRTRIVSAPYALSTSPTGICTSCTSAYADDFDRTSVGPAWQVCGNVTIVNNALQLQNSSAGPNNCPAPGGNSAYAKLIAPGTETRDGTVQFDLNGGIPAGNDQFAIGFGSFHMFSESQIPRIELYGPNGVLASLPGLGLSAGRYELVVTGSLVRFHNLAGGTTVDLVATDPTPTGSGPLWMYVNETTRSVDNLLLNVGACQ